MALLAGAAGLLSLVSAKSADLVGVISVTTVPAAGFAVIGAAIGGWDVALESTAQLALNLTGIVHAGVLVLWLHRDTGHYAQPRSATNLVPLVTPTTSGERPTQRDETCSPPSDSSPSWSS